MPTEVILPKVDMDMETGTISAWHVADGDTVAQGDPLFDIETDKAAMEVESPATGVLRHILAPVGKTVPIGRTVAWVFGEGEDIPDAPPELPEQAGASATRAHDPVTEPATALVAPTSGSQTTRATPAARRLALDAGLSIADITGTGPRDRVQSGDVRTLMRSDARASSAPAQITWASQGAALHIVKSGAGDATPRLLIHGLGADANTWAFVEKDLAAKGPVLRLELPCHGKSPRQKVENFAQLAAAVRSTFDTLNMERVHLIGHSLGAALALAIADTRPRSIQALTLISPAGLGPQINGDILAGVARATSPASLGPWLRQMVGDPEVISDNYVKAAMMTRKDPDLRAAQIAMQQAIFPDHTQSFDLSAALHRLSVPARIIFGKKDQVIPWTHALRAPGHISLNLFEGLGHMPHFEDPEAVQALL